MAQARLFVEKRPYQERVSLERTMSQTMYFISTKNCKIVVFAFYYKNLSSVKSIKSKSYVLVHCHLIYGIQYLELYQCFRPKEF
jgi:hypothetical protein